MFSGLHLGPGQVRYLIFGRVKLEKGGYSGNECDNLMLCNFSNSTGSIDE